MELGAPRRIMDPPQLTAKADTFVDWPQIMEEQRMDEDSGRAIHKFPGFGGKFHESHILLSACGKEQVARELGGSGLFTNALMKELPKEFGPAKGSQGTLTYSTLMTRLNMPELCVSFRIASTASGHTNTLLARHPTAKVATSTICSSPGREQRQTRCLYRAGKRR